MKLDVRKISTFLDELGDHDEFLTALSGSVVPALATEDGGALSKKERRDLLRRSRAGEQIELTITAETYRQPDAPIPLPASMASKANKKFVRFAPDQLDAVAKSFRRGLFMRDHAREQLAVGGEIEDSEAVALEGEVVFVQRLRAVEPWAVQLALTGTMRTFSIGWGPRRGGLEGFVRSAVCSVCDAPMFARGCPHLPGQIVKVDDGGERVIVELIWRDVKGAEVSAVAFPAVDKTKVQAIRSALGELSEANQPENEDTTEPDEMDQIRKLLGLSDDASVEDVVAALSARLSAPSPDLSEITGRAERAEMSLAAEREASVRLRDRVQELEAAQAAADQAALSARIDQLVERGMAEGRILPREDESGESVPSAGERLIRRLAGEDFDEAAAYLAEMPQIVPVDRQSRDDVEVKTAAHPKLSASELSLCRQMGITPEQYLEHGYGVAPDADEADDNEDDSAE